MSGDNLYILLKKTHQKHVFIELYDSVCKTLLWDLSSSIALCADTRANRLKWCTALDVGRWCIKLAWTYYSSQWPEATALVTSRWMFCVPLQHRALVAMKGHGRDPPPPRPLCLISAAASRRHLLVHWQLSALSYLLEAHAVHSLQDKACLHLGIINNISEKNRRDTYSLPLCHILANEILTSRLCLILRCYIETFQDIDALERAAFWPDVTLCLRLSCVAVLRCWYSLLQRLSRCW